MSFTHSKSARARRRSTTLRSRGGGLRKSSGKDGGRVAEENIPDSLMTPSRGNVFEDLGFPPEDAQNLLLRSQLMLSIERLIKRRQLSQARAAKLFGVTQPCVSDLMRGKIDRCSIDSLITLLGRAGVEVGLTYGNPGRAA